MAAFPERVPLISVNGIEIGLVKSRFEAENGDLCIDAEFYPGLSVSHVVPFDPGNHHNALKCPYCCPWRDGWPAGDELGLYVVELKCRDVVAMRVSESTSDEFTREMSDDMDGVCFNVGNLAPVESYWGKAKRHLGPLPE